MESRRIREELDDAVWIKDETCRDENNRVDAYGMGRFFRYLSHQF